MKFFFTILLMSMVLCNEFVSVLDMELVECNPLESSYEGEMEEELSESLEDLMKIKFDNASLYDYEKVNPRNESILNWLISIHFMEIHSPPPEFS